MKHFSFNQSFIKSILVVVLTVCSLQMWGETAPFAPSDFSGQGTSGTGSAISATVSTVTFACDKGYGTTQVRCYSGGKITISSANTITAISFTFSGSYTGGLSTSYTGLSTTSWEQTLTSQARITACTVTYTAGGGCSNKVTISAGSTSHGTFDLDKTGAQETCSGLVVTVTDIDPADGYMFDHIEQSGVAAGDVTINNAAKTVTYASNVTGTSSITVVFEAAPTHTVTWSMNGDETNTTDFYEGQAIVFPSSADGCDTKTFMGWVSAVIPTPTDEEPTFVTSATMPDHDMTYYAVFADEDGSGAPSLTKMVKDDTFANGDKIVIVAHGTTVALYQETANTSYVQKWTFDNKVATVAADDKKWITVTATTGGWYLGDATNGYLNNSSNSLYCDNDQSVWTLYDNGDGTFNLVSTVYLSYRSDLTASNQLWRGGSAAGTSGVSTLDIYKYTSGSTTYSGYTTSCITPTNVTVTFDANGGEGTMDPQVIPYNTATALNANSFTRDGYTFQGWATSASGEKVHNDEASVTLKKNTTLYAVWQKNSYTITLIDPAHGSIETSPANTAEYGATVTVTVTPSSGYLFGSMTVTNNTTSATIATSGSGATQTFPMPASNVTITATVTEIPTYTVTWHMNGDENTKDNYEEGQAIAFPSSADGCDGKVFRGWSAAPVAETDIEPSYVTSATMPAHDVTYYAVFAEASGSGGDAAWTETAITDLTGTDIFVIVGNTGSANYALPNNASSTPDAISVTISAGKITSTVANNLKWNISGNSTSGYTFYPNGSTTTWLYSNTTASSSSNTNIRIGSGARKVWSYTSGNQLVTDDEYTDRYLAVQGGSDFRGYTSSTTSATTFKFYAYSAGTTYSGYTTTCGAGISAQNVGWITSSVGQKVKRVINVSAKNFDDPTTLSVSCDNSHFNVSLAATAVPAGAAGLTTTLTVEYTPTAQGREENVEIELTAGDKSRTIIVNGRCVPDEFLLITNKSSKWYALPANMSGGADEYAGVEVSPNDPTTPTVVPVSPTTTIYSMASVANSRYADNGNCVRLVGNGNLCLWSNLASTTGKTNIQNKTQVATAATDNHDWLLTTTDGIRYTIANPHHPHYGTGRRLGYGTKFGMYEEDTEFFIVSAGCSSQPGEVAVSPRRVEATFSWVSNTTDMHIDLYTNELMTEGHLPATASSSPYVFTGLEESKPYWYKLTPGTDIDCAVTGTFTTTGPIIDIVEWEENGVVLFIDKGEINPKIVIDGQEEHGSITGGGGNATELFFAKYFEGAGSMKLLSIFNGTNDAITLSGYKFVDRHAGSGASSFGSDVEYDLTSLGSINAGQEIIFFTRPKSTEVELSGCSTDFLNSVATKDKPTDNPRWIECASGKYADKAIEFNGNDAILLKKNGTIIDVIGALNKPGKGSNCSGEDAWEGTIKNMDKGKSPSDPVFDAFYETSSKSPVTKADSIALLAGFGINLSADEIDISTARCIFFRDKRVTSGDSAVLMNAGDNFVTFTNHDSFKSEWYGRSVCMTTAMKTAAGVTNDAQATCNSYQDIANMDYNEYYIDWHNIDPGTELSDFSVDPETKEYTIPIDDMRQYACLQLRFQLVNGGNVLTEASQQVPIVVVGNDVDTNDPLFSELVVDKGTGDPSYSHSVERCKDCDVVILGSAKLTKGPDSDEKDVPRVGNVKVYPGGKLVVPSGTTYRMKSLALRRQEDEVATANVEGDITFIAPAASPAPARRDNGEKQIRKAATGKKNTYFDLRVDPTNWHYFSLPYDCNVADIRYANPEETAIPVLGTDYLIKWYNGEKRAATQAGGCWEMVAADGTLKAGVGYIFSIPGDGSVRREFRFPMDNEVVEQETADKIAAPVYGYGCDNTEEVRPNHRGWNLLGNPYMMPYTSDITNPLLTGYIVEDHSTDPWDGHYTFDVDPTTHTYLRYIVEPVNNGWSEYRQVSIEDYPMTPFTCYFVQVGGIDPAAEQGVEFHVARVNRSPIRRAPAEYEEVEDTHPVWCAVTLTNPNGEKDETTMLISNDFTDEYDMMNDLVKMRGTYYQYAQITTKPVLASRNNEGEMAFNALPDSSALAGIPLNYFAASQGSYTIAYNDKYDKDREVKEVKLWDKTTNQWYNLMDEPYSFNTARTDNKDRFVLSVRVERKQNQVTTSMEDIESYRGDKPRKLLINGHVYIQRGKDVYDVTGKQVENF